MKLVDIIRKARKVYRDTMNKIEAIRTIREARPDVGLKEAKDFFDWMDVNGDGLSALKLAGHWCEEHWQDNEICGCASNTNAAGAGTSGGTKPVFEDALSESIPPRRDTGTTFPAPVPVLSESDFAPSGLPTVAGMIRLNVNCRCGVPNCNNEYHALATYLSKNPDAWKLWNAALDRYIEEQQQL